MVSILTGPDDKKCWFCKALMQNKDNPYSTGVFYKLNNKQEVCVESLIRYCPHCGKEILSENDYREQYMKTFHKDERTFQIKGRIATKKLIKAMLDAEDKYYN